MGKKKSFIDKKSATVFSVVHRSQRDTGGGDDASPFVLLAHDRKPPPRARAAGARAVSAGAPSTT